MSHTISTPTPTKKRKRSPSPTRKKARVEEVEKKPRVGEHTPTITSHPVITHPPVIISRPPVLTHTPTTTPLSREGQSELDRFYREIDSLTHTSLPPLSTPTPTVTPTVTPSATRPKPLNPFKKRIKFLRENFGPNYHDASHFKPTDLKTKQGVWSAELPQVKEWIGEAINHIYYDDDAIVLSKPGEGKYKAGRNFLVDMGKPVGYLTGSSVPRGTQPEARYIGLYVDKNGITVSAVPCTPETF
jgi:hypothetical protein